MTLREVERLAKLDDTIVVRTHGQSAACALLRLDDYVLDALLAVASDHALKFAAVRIDLRSAFELCEFFSENLFPVSGTFRVPSTGLTSRSRGTRLLRLSFTSSAAASALIIAVAKSLLLLRTSTMSDPGFSALN